MTDVIDYRSMLGQHIGDIRRAREISQESLSELINMSRTYMGYVEQGARSPSLKTLLEISEALDVRMPDLFDFEYPTTVEYDSGSENPTDEQE